MIDFETMPTQTVLLCGVGGQGTITAADLLAKTITASGLKVKMSEIHGMSQRGGAVTTIVRFGKEVNSVVCDEGCADYLLSFEMLEALRNLPFLKTDGVLLVNSESIKPQSVLTGKAQMPHNLKQRLLNSNAQLLDATELARSAGTTKCANVVLLGALAATMPFDLDVWREVIRNKVPPKTLDINLKAFDLGRESVTG